MKTLGHYIVLLGAYMRVNWRGSLEYRANFVFETLISVLEVGMYLFYWKIFFTISDGIPGASFEQLAALVVFNHIIYGVVDTLMGNHIWDAGEHIIKGQLDIYLVQPKSPIYQLFFSGARPVRAIQVAVGVAVYFVLIPPTAHSIAVLAIGTLTGASIFAAWVIAANAVVFRLGNVILVYKLLILILHFAKKPATIFSAGVRFVLYTIVPAAFLGSVQAEQVFHPGPAAILGLLTLAVVAPFIAVVAFRRGMRLYESGNLIGVRM